MKVSFTILFIFLFTCLHHCGKYQPTLDLHDAVQSGSIISVRQALLAGADINEKNNVGQTPIQQATQLPSLDIFELLLEYGADLNVNDGMILTPILSRNNMELFVRILKEDAYVDTLIEELYYMIDRLPVDEVDVVKAILENGTTRDGNRQSLLNGLYYFAAYRGDRYLLTLLEEEGAEVFPGYSIEDQEFNTKTAEEVLTDPDVSGWGIKSALNQAAYGGHLELVKELHDKGSPLFGALNFAIRNGHGEIVSYVLEQGWDLNQEIEKNRFTLHSFDWRGKPSQYYILTILIEHGLLDQDQIHHAYELLGRFAGSGHTEAIQLLFDHGLDVMYNHTDPKFNLLERALWSDNIENLKLIVERGGEALIQSPGVNGALVDVLTRIHLDRENYFYYLLENGADIKQVNEQGESVLHIAVQQDMLEIVELSLKEGVAINIQTIDGITPLMTAVITGSLSMTDYLLQHGAETQIQDGERKTALDYAREFADQEMIELLLNEN